MGQRYLLLAGFVIKQGNCPAVFSTFEKGLFRLYWPDVFTHARERSGKKLFMNLLWNVIGIFIMIAPGFILLKKGWIKDETVTSLSMILVWVFYPCLVFTSITESFTFASLLKVWILPVSVMAIFICGYLVGLVLSPFIHFSSRDQRGAFLFQCTVNNYSFFPLAIVSGMFGSAGVSILMFSSLGAELLLWTLGIFILKGEGFNRHNLKHLLSPPLCALYAAALCLVLHHVKGMESSIFSIPGSPFAIIHSTLSVMGKCTIPLAMIISGARLAEMSFDVLRDGMVWLTSFFRSIGVPLVAWGMLLLMPLSSEHRSIMIIVAVMPAAAASLFLSQLYGSDRNLINGSFLLTHLMSLITVPALLSFML